MSSSGQRTPLMSRLQASYIAVVAVVAVGPACGSQRIADYLEDLENCSLSASTTAETGTTQGSGSSEDTSSSGSSETTVAGSETMGTSTTESSDTTEAAGTTEASSGGPMAACGNGVYGRANSGGSVS